MEPVETHRVVVSNHDHPVGGIKELPGNRPATERAGLLTRTDGLARSDLTHGEI